MQPRSLSSAVASSAHLPPADESRPLAADIAAPNYPEERPLKGWALVARELGTLPKRAATRLRTARCGWVAVALVPFGLLLLVI